MLVQLVGRFLNKFTATEIAYGSSYFALLTGLVLVAVKIFADLRSPRRHLKQLKRYGVNTKSNFADQYDAKYDRSEDSDNDEPIIVKALFVHPLKSCKYIEVDRAPITKTGLEFDRCFAFATEIEKGASEVDPSATWRLITQRTKPMMSQIGIELWLPDHYDDPSHRQSVQKNGFMVVTFPDPDPPSQFGRLKTFLSTWSFSNPQITFIVPLMPTATQIKQHKIQTLPFVIHVRTAHGLDLGTLPEVAAAIPKLKTFLKIPKREQLTLLRCTPDTLVRTTKNLAPLKHIGSPAVHGYTDQQPININSLSSAHAVSTLLPPETQPMDALRFRANIWITGAPAYAEETWKRCQIVPKKSHKSSQPTNRASTKLSVVCRTSRCTMPNVNLNTGTFDHDNPVQGKKKGKPQPSTTLVEYRTVEDGNKQALGYLGMHCVPEDSSLDEAERRDERPYVQVGDEIVVLERGEHLYGSTGNDY